MGRKIIRAMDSALDAVVLCICALLLAIGVYSLCDNLYVYRHAKDNSILSYKPEQNKTLGEVKTEAGEAAEQGGKQPAPVVFENQVAWLTVDGTPIDFSADIFGAGRENKTVPGPFASLNVEGKNVVL